MIFIRIGDFDMFKQILPLSSIIGLRFFGLFIVLPVLSAYALGLEGATPLLAGMAMSGYAFTQAIFQVPFGRLSDKMGRKKTLLIGLMIFIVGPIVCAISDNIYTLLIGRFLQGAGAIGSVVTAMIADLVKEEQRAHAMAIMGGVIAMSFSGAMIIAPIVGGTWGVDKQVRDNHRIEIACCPSLWCNKREYISRPLYENLVNALFLHVQYHRR